MEVTNKAFKAYDVRGVYPTEVNEEMAYRVGRIFSAMFAAETVVVGHDIRLSGPAIVAALTEGLRHGGTKVIDPPIYSSLQKFSLHFGSCMKIVTFWL